MHWRPPCRPRPTTMRAPVTRSSTAGTPRTRCELRVTDLADATRRPRPCRYARAPTTRCGCATPGATSSRPSAPGPPARGAARSRCSGRGTTQCAPPGSDADRRAHAHRARRRPPRSRRRAARRGLQWAYDGFRLVPLHRLRGPVPAGPESRCLTPGDADRRRRHGRRAFFGEVMRLAEEEPPDLEVRVLLGRCASSSRGSRCAPSSRRGSRAGRRAAVTPWAEAGRSRRATRSGWLSIPRRARAAWTTWPARRPRTSAATPIRRPTRCWHASTPTRTASRCRATTVRAALAPDAPPPADGFWELTASGGDPPALVRPATSTA